MACDYQYYKDPNSYYPMLYCNIDNKRCLYSKRCELEKRFISLDNTKECYKYNMKKIKNIPEGSFYVVNKRPSRNGFYVYVEIDGKNVKLNIEDKDFNQDYVYLKKTDVGYEVSKVPFAIEIVEDKPIEPKKKTVTRKKKISSEKTN